MFDIPKFKEEEVICLVSSDGTKMVHCSAENKKALAAALEKGFTQSSVIPSLKVTHGDKTVYIPLIPINKLVDV